MAIAHREARAETRVEELRAIRTQAVEDAKRHSFRLGEAVAEFQDGALTSQEVSRIYRREYRAPRGGESLLDTLKSNAWIAALLLLIVAVFRDALKSALMRVVALLGRAAYNRLAGSRLLRRRAVRKYRRALADSVGRIQVPFRPNRPLAMEDIYVELRITEGGEAEALRAPVVLASAHRIVVTGPPGAGKSILLRHLAATNAGRGTPLPSNPIPVLLELHRVVRDLDSGASLEEHIVHAFARYGFPHATKFVVQALERGWLLLLFDGLDEVPSAERGQVAERLRDLLEQERRCSVVVTCRTAVYRGELDTAVDRVVELEPFRDQQILAFLKSWRQAMPPEKSPAQLMAALREQPKLLAAARNPLLLTIITHLYSDSLTYVLPRSRAEFYRQAASILLDKWQGHLGQNRFEGAEKRTVLGEVALAMQRQQEQAEGEERRTIARDQLFTCVAAVLPSLGRDPAEAAEMVREIVERSGLLLALDEATRYAFAHLTFQEYFAAEALLNQPDVLIRSFSADVDAWREVAVLWCGLAPDATSQIEAIHELDLGAALACVAEAASVDRDTSSRILDPVVQAVIHGEASEEFQHALGAVSADTRPRGEATLQQLIDGLRQADGENAERAVASALSSSNRLQAAEALVAWVLIQPRLADYVIRMGDLAVPALAEVGRTSDSVAICTCLAGIGTGDAAVALATIMLRNDSLETAAAWGLASLVGTPLAADALNVVRLDERMRQRPAFDWLWAPFATGSSRDLLWLIGRVAYLIWETNDPDDMVATPDRRIAAAIAGMEPNPGGEQVPQPVIGRFLAAAAASGHEFDRLDPTRVELKSGRSHRLRPDEQIELDRYRGLFRAATLVVGDEHFRADDHPPTEDSDLTLAVIRELLDDWPIWTGLVSRLPASLRWRLLMGLSSSGHISSESWPSVCSSRSYQFEKSRYFDGLIVVIVAAVAAALGEGVYLSFAAASVVVSALAVAGCVILVTSVTGILVDALYSGVGRFGLDDEAIVILLIPPLSLALALDSLRSGTFDKQDALLLFFVGFVPTLAWLDYEALRIVLPVVTTAWMLGACAVVIILLFARGKRKEARLSTPFAGMLVGE